MRAALAARATRSLGHQVRVADDDPGDRFEDDLGSQDQHVRRGGQRRERAAVATQLSVNWFADLEKRAMTSTTASETTNTQWKWEIVSRAGPSHPLIPCMATVRPSRRRAQETVRRLCLHAERACLRRPRMLGGHGPRRRSLLSDRDASRSPLTTSVASGPMTTRSCHPRHVASLPTTQPPSRRRSRSRHHLSG